MYLSATVAVVNAEEMNGTDLAGGSRTGSSTTADVIASAWHESRNNSDGVLHLFPSSNHWSMSPTHSLVIYSYAPLPHYGRHHNLLRRGRFVFVSFIGHSYQRRCKNHSVHCERWNFAWTATDRGNVAGTVEVTEIVSAENGGNAWSGASWSLIRVDSFKFRIWIVQRFHNGAVIEWEREGGGRRRRRRDDKKEKKGQVRNWHVWGKLLRVFLMAHASIVNL